MDRETESRRIGRLANPEWNELFLADTSPKARHPNL
jgi:hypothetical protein